MGVGTRFKIGKLAVYTGALVVHAEYRRLLQYGLFWIKALVHALNAVHSFTNSSSVQRMHANCSLPSMATESIISVVQYQYLTWSFRRCMKLNIESELPSRSGVKYSSLMLGSRPLSALPRSL